MEDKLIEYIDLTMKQDVSSAAAFAVPEKPKDYVAMQLEAIGEAVRANLNQKQQFECLHEMQAVLYRHMQQQQQQQQQQAMNFGQQQRGQHFTGEYQQLLYKDL